MFWPDTVRTLEWPGTSEEEAENNLSEAFYNEDIIDFPRSHDYWNRPQPEFKTPIIMDTGSLYTKLGFANDKAPCCEFETAIGEKYIGNKRKICIGTKLQSHKYDADVSLIYPIKNGIIDNFDEMEKFWHHCLYKSLKCIPAEHPLLLIEPALNPKRNRERMLQILFEQFQLFFTYFASSPVLSLYSSGRTTGLAVECGYEQTQIVAVYEGSVLPDAVIKLPIGGKHVTEYLRKQLLKKYDNLIDLHLDNYREIKEKYAYICEDGVEVERMKMFCSHPEWLISGYFRDFEMNYSTSMSIDVERMCDMYCGDKSRFIIQKKEYKLPDGNVINLCEQMYECAEIMLNPKLIGLEHDGIPAVVTEVISRCDVNIRDDLFRNIILCGGNSMLHGMRQRLQKNIMCDNIIHIAEERKYNAWIGGSILASLDAFDDMWISSSEYDSAGPSIVHRKCY